MRIAAYARVSTADQQTLEMQLESIAKTAKTRDWSVVLEVKEVGSGASDRPKREALMKAARRREIDAIVVWRLDRWGRSLADVVVTLRELTELGVGFVSLTEALDLTTATGRAMAGLLAVFAEFEREVLRERVRAGIAQARKRGVRLGRPPTAAGKEHEAGELYESGLSKQAISRALGIPRTSLRRLLSREPRLDAVPTVRL